jgi:hypothetical protein
MAVVEVFLRVGKALLVMKASRKREAKVQPKRRSTSATVSSSIQPVTLSSSPTMRTLNFEMCRGRLHAYHIAEVNADMYAEYIAIGCSASILYFFGNHPHYSLLRPPNFSDDRDNRRSTQLQNLAFQLGVEVVVDFVSTV